MISCRKMDGISTICQTLFIPVLSLKVRQQTACQRCSAENPLVICCRSQVCFQDLQSVLTWLADTWKQRPEPTLHGNNYIRVILFAVAFPAELSDNCVTAALTSHAFLLCWLLCVAELVAFSCIKWHFTTVTPLYSHSRGQMHDNCICTSCSAFTSLHHHYVLTLSSWGLFYSDTFSSSGLL